MIRKLAVGAVVALVAVMFLVTGTDAQQVQYGDPEMRVNGSAVLTASTSGVSGTIVSASARMANTDPSKVIYTTPASGQFILTQVCRTGLNTAFGSAFTGSTFGDIAGVDRIPDDDETECREYFPGLALPQNETLTVYPGSWPTTIVTIIGVYQP